MARSISPSFMTSSTLSINSSKVSGCLRASSAISGLSVRLPWYRGAYTISSMGLSTDNFTWLNRMKKYLRDSSSCWCNVSRWLEGFLRIRPAKNWIRNFLPCASKLSIDFGRSFLNQSRTFFREDERKGSASHFFWDIVEIQMSPIIIQMFGWILDPGEGLYA